MADLTDALDCAVIAADAAMQATVALWDHLSPAEQDRWLESAATSWPRRDIFIKAVLPAAAKVIADEREDRLREDEADQ